MQETSDIHLLELCLAGDRDAYGQLVARYQALIWDLWLGSEIKTDAANFYTRFGVNGLIGLIVLIFAIILIGWRLNPAMRRRS